MKRLIVGLVACASLGLSACAMTGSASRTGYAAIVMLTEAGETTGNPKGAKNGKACSQNIIGLISMGDSSLAAAMEDGEITKVSSVDYKYQQFFNVYGEVCTLVNGD